MLISKFNLCVKWGSTIKRGPAVKWGSTTDRVRSPGPNFKLKDLPSVLILIIADQIINDSLCCSNKYN